MGQILIRNLPDSVIESFRTKASLAGQSLEQTVREILVKHAPFTAQECHAISQRFLAEFPEPLTPLTKDDYREGLE